MQPEEAGRRQEGERHEHHPGIPALQGGGAGAIGDDGAEGAGAEDEPEVRRVVLPHDVEVGPAQQERQARERQQERHHGGSHG